LTDCIRSDELAAVAAALQTQILRDFVPEWGACAVVGAFPFEAIPAGYTPLIVQDTLESEGINGFHRTRCEDTPYMVVPHGPSWPLAASHELLRMLANPTGAARLAGPSCMSGQGTVEYLIDVCAPCQDVSAAYTIDGIPVSDFCLRSFFGPAGPGASFTGAVRDAFTPAAGGVLTWLADDTLIYQIRADHQGQGRVHGGFSPANRARLLMRELVDRLTPDRASRLSNAPRTQKLTDAEQNARRARLTNMIRFREDIAWRFGHASADTQDIVPRRAARRANAYAAGGARSGQYAASGEVATTVRTAS
jgi:hypothetical protein